jgi:ribosomal protein S18 acetylase RimI-like enzyme
MVITMCVFVNMKIELSNTINENYDKLIKDRLTESSLLVSQLEYQKKDLRVYSYINEKLVGGLIGYTIWGWLYIGNLWVDSKFRDNNIGTLLVKNAESVAKDRGCDFSYLNTFSYQAVEFYKKLGYEKFGVLENFPKNHQRVFMKKIL